MTDTPRPVPPPLAVVTGAARVLSVPGAGAVLLKDLCDFLQTALPASQIRIRVGTRNSDEHTCGEAVAGEAPFVAAVPMGRDRLVTIEAYHTLRPPAELRPILETTATLLVTMLPAITQPDADAATERRLTRLTIDSLPLGLYLVDRDYRIVVWNRKRETGTQGLRREEVLGRTVFDVLSRQDPDVLRAEFDHVFRTGEPHESEQLVQSGSDARIFRTSRLPMRLEGSEVSHVVTIGEDVTESRAMNQSMYQTEKLAAVGQLAAGVMHEINNPLATIGACVTAIASRLGVSAEPVVREYLDIIESEVMRCTNIVDGLLDFSRAGRAGGSFEECDLNALLDRTLYLLKHHQRFRRLEVTRDMQASLPAVKGNAERLIQAIMAILLNAADATNGNGKVTVCTRVEGLFVVTELTDDGPGIPADVVPKIFEPFYTTKGPSRGTGLGLAISYGIVADHRGKLDVRSEPGRGTTFRMAIPIAREAVA
ncbi:MAG: ATP-binding protein [Gemmatimonadales bacterium]